MRIMGNGIWLRRLAVVGLPLVLVASASFGGSGTVERAPLIFFSTSPTPNADPGLRGALRVDPAVAVSYGGNLVAGQKYMVIRGKEGQSDSYASVKQLAEFIIQNSVHGTGEWRPLNKNIETLFYSTEPLVMSCGKISVFFRDLLDRHMGVDSRRIRHITMHDDRSFDPTSVTDGYLKGGHAVVEVFFPDLEKWVVFDLDKGVLPSLGEIPLSMLEIQALDESRIAFEPLGRDEFGKGPKYRENVNSYYRSAANVFGIKVSEEYVFLFSAPREFGDIFKRNFELATPRKAILVTDPGSYRDRFYRAPF